MSAYDIQWVLRKELNPQVVSFEEEIKPPQKTSTYDI